MIIPLKEINYNLFTACAGVKRKRMEMYLNLFVLQDENTKSLLVGAEEPLVIL